MFGHLNEIASSQSRLVQNLGALTNEQACQPSRLPEWSRALLIAHLRFAGEALLRSAEAAAIGKSAAMYHGGETQRDSEIASGSGRPAADLVAELADVCRRIDARLESLPEAAWDVEAVSRRGPAPLRALALQRWIDVEAHHVDLDLGYTTDDWPDALVNAILPDWMGVMPALHNRPDAVPHTGSWHLHRSDGEGEWTLHADGKRAWLTEGHEEADCTIEGPGRALLALIFGRDASQHLNARGNQRLALGFKSVFPGP